MSASLRSFSLSFSFCRSRKRRCATRFFSRVLHVQVRFATNVTNVIGRTWVQSTAWCMVTDSRPLADQHSAAHAGDRRLPCMHNDHSTRSRLTVRQSQCQNALVVTLVRVVCAARGLTYRCRRKLCRLQQALVGV